MATMTPRSRVAVAAWAGRWVLAGCLLAATLAPAGCGYTQKDLYATDVRTVAVPIFKNRSFYQGLEFDLTEAVIKEIELRTPYKVVPQASADTILEGQVVQVSQGRLSRTNLGAVAQEEELRIVATFEWKNLKTGQTLRRRDGISSAGRAVATRPVGEPVSMGQHQAVQRMAGQVVAMMRADW